MSRDTYDVAQRKAEGFTFYCPHGHGQVFRAGETEADKLRRARDNLKQQQARYEDWLRDANEARKSAERQAAAAKGQVTRLKNRASAGVCPCCNRTITQLARHMKTKHPDFVAENVVHLAAAKRRPSA